MKQRKKWGYCVHFIYLIDINVYEDTYTYCFSILISILFVSLYLTIRKIDSMSERFIYESFGHTIGSHRLLLILVRSFDLKLKSNGKLDFFSS